MKRLYKVIPSMLCIITMFFTDIVPVFAVTENVAETAAKTVNVSTETDDEGAGEEGSEEDGDSQDENGDLNSKAAGEDGASEKSSNLTIPRMDPAEMTEVKISSYEDWCDLVKKCRLDTWSADKYVVLTDDIDCNMQRITPVPYFAGVFDGKGHTINKAAFTEEQNYVGIFSKTAASAVIRNVNVIGVIKPAGKPFGVGGIVGDNNGMIAGCKFDGYVEGYDYIGGIAGYNEASGIISGCSVTGKITGLHYVGGICGTNTGLVTGCAAAADINTITKDVETSISDIKVEEVFTSLLNFGREEGNKKTIRSSTNPVDVGGIVGHNTGEISSCANDSNVGYEHVGYNIGGIAGRQSGYIHDCSNRGNIRGRKDVGGIVGQAEPYIRLDLTSDVIDQINKSINSLHDSIERTIKDTNNSSGVVSARLNVIKTFADKALSDTGYLANSTTDFVNGVTGATNEIVGRMENVMGEFAASDGPFESLERSGSNLKDAAKDVEEMAEDLDIYNYMDETETLQYDNAKKNIRDATDEYSGYYRKKYDETKPDLYDRKYYQILTGAEKLPDERPSKEQIAEAEQGKTEEEIAKAKGEATEYAAKEAGGAAADYAESQYDEHHEGHTYTEDMEEYSTTIANLVLKYSDNMTSDTEDDVKDAVEDVKKMAGNLKDTGSRLREIIGNTASQSPVRFPQLSDEYKLHANSLVANIQGMSDNLGFLNSEMSGSTDAVCNDLEGVNDQFASMMLLFTDAMDGALDMDYSEVFEDESNDVCEDSVDATVADCRNIGMIYGDINTGGIAGTMAQEYDFDLESDITGVKDSARKSTYRTKCVLRRDGNEGEIKGRKSYVGGICGLCEIGTILKCENLAKVSSESGDYVGGIAGRSYATIRNSYEKGVLGGGSYIGGITGCGGDIMDCAAMPNVTDGVNFTGAITGSADDDGKIKGNVFVSDELAGIDRISRAGAAEPVSYNEMLAAEEVPDDFSTMKVNFIVDDKVVATLDKKQGEVISPSETPVEAQISSHKEKADDADDGKLHLADDEYISWKCDKEIPVDEDMEIEGEIVRFSTSLASEQLRSNNQSVLLVDGRFFKGAKLSVAAVPNNDADCEEYVVDIPDDGQDSHKIRYMKPLDAKKVRIYVSSGGKYEEVATEEYGKYLTFTASGNKVNIRAVEEEQHDFMKWLICGATVLALIIIMIVLIKVLSSKKRKHAKKKVSNKS